MKTKTLMTVIVILLSLSLITSISAAAKSISYAENNIEINISKMNENVSPYFQVKYNYCRNKYPDKNASINLLMINGGFVNVGTEVEYIHNFCPNSVKYNIIVNIISADDNKHKKLYTTNEGLEIVRSKVDGIYENIVKTIKNNIENGQFTNEALKTAYSAAIAADCCSTKFNIFKVSGILLDIVR